MPLFSLYPDEWWPVLTLLRERDEGSDEKCVEFLEVEIDDLKRVLAEFDEWQKKIADRFGTTQPETHSLVWPLLRKTT